MYLVSSSQPLIQQKQILIIDCSSLPPDGKFPPGVCTIEGTAFVSSSSWMSPHILMKGNVKVRKLHLYRASRLGLYSSHFRRCNSPFSTLFILNRKVILRTVQIQESESVEQ